MYSLFFLLRWLLHVSTKQCHPQGATMFLSEPLQRQYGSRHVTGRITEPTYRRTTKRTEKVHYQVHTDCMHLVVYLLSSLYSTPVCRFRHMSCDLSPTILTLKWLRKEHSRSLRMALFCRNI
jgi:hypothetical protein